ncbi:hypothetical protein T10_1742 [Trichinella papuae]|uniref:Uncharacterized protein n=1 Tax=Trichinella papuae TaxID=268474 RepID=A0A0V1LYB8_9BILA|nr:hypothetical protein T10_1742 [Trichinella papuae]
MFPLVKCKHPGSVLRELQRCCFPPKMNGIDQKKSGNDNEPGRTLQGSVFVEILV